MHTAKASAYAVVGEECHIISPKLGGPRGGLSGSTNLDGHENLILLCPSDHTMIDQIPDDYPPERLSALKGAHEGWVQSRLEKPDSSNVSVQRRRPAHLLEIQDAETLIEIVMGAMDCSLDHEELDSETDVEEVGGLLQAIFDHSEIWSDLEPYARVRARHELGELLRNARTHGWRVFGARGRGELREGSEAPSRWDTAYLRVVREDSPEIVGLRGDREPGAQGVPPDQQGA